VAQHAVENVLKAAGRLQIAGIDSMASHQPLPVTGQEFLEERLPNFNKNQRIEPQLCPPVQFTAQARRNSVEVPSTNSRLQTIPRIRNKSWDNFGTTLQDQFRSYRMRLSLKSLPINWQCPICRATVHLLETILPPP